MGNCTNKLEHCVTITPSILDDNDDVEDFVAAALTTSTVKIQPCIHEADRCHSTGTMGDCCRHGCVHAIGEEYGYCGAISNSTEPPPSTTTSTDKPKCLEAGTDCTVSGSLGFCCLGFCHVLARRHTVGICVSPNQESNETRQVENDHSWIIYTSITLSVFILLVLGFLWLYYRQKRLEKDLTRKESNRFLHGNPKCARVNGYAHEIVDNLPYKKEFEIPESDFSVDFESKLGSGCFGLVLKGKVRSIEVAVKTIQSNLSDGLHLRSLLSEIKTLQYIGSFQHIVTMIGSNTSNLDKGLFVYKNVFLFLEYCPLGSLEKYLRENKYNFVDFQHNANNKTLNSNKLLQWSLQITNAMKFLAMKKVIHADLATRNVLLYTIDCVKLTDFGLSRKLYDYGNYVKTQQEPLPWRWMSLESLTQLSFSHQSDVWSLGVTFWEIFSLGDVPYPGLTWNNEFVYCLQNDMRPTKPSIASDEIYAIMLDCWKPMPDTRPNFEDIYRRLHEYQKNNVNSIS